VVVGRIILLATHLARSLAGSGRVRRQPWPRSWIVDTARQFDSSRRLYVTWVTPPVGR
jgi:hypothetical protein